MNYIFPVKDYLTITQPYKGVSKHAGIDFGWRKENSAQPIVACEDGVVVTSVDGYGNTYPKNKIYGNYVTIKHADGNYTLYAHLAKGVAVKKSAVVKKGDVIGYMGNSGYSTGQHLHWEFRKGSNSKSNAVDGLEYIRLEGDTPVVSDHTLEADRIKQRTLRTGTPVAPDPAKDQINISVINLRARGGYGLSADILGLCNDGFYDVLETAEADGYTWYRTPEFWCAGVTGVAFFPAVRLHDVLIKGASDSDLVSLEAVAKQLKLEYTII